MIVLRIDHDQHILQVKKYWIDILVFWGQILQSRYGFKSNSHGDLVSGLIKLQKLLNALCKLEAL